MIKRSLTILLLVFAFPLATGSASPNATPAMGVGGSAATSSRGTGT